MRRRGAWVFVALLPLAVQATQGGASFDCSKPEAGSIEALVCADAGLSALDRKLSQVYAAASAKAVNEHPPVLKAEQRGWIKGRDECWNSEDRRACVETQYEQRIAELQARYRLIEPTAKARYACDGNPKNEVIATFFPTDPMTAVVEHGDGTSLMFVQPSGSGARYQGRNESLWEHQGEARVTWGAGSPEMHCKRTEVH